MDKSISLEEILNVKYLGDWSWSPDGKWIAYLWDDGGVVDVWLVGSTGVQAQRKLTAAKDKVAGFAWTQANSLVVLLDSDLWQYAVDTNTEPQRLTATSDVSQLKISHKGHLAYIAGGALYIQREPQEPSHKIKIGKCVSLYAWSESGLLLFRHVDDIKVPHIGVATSEGIFLWATRGTQGLVGEGHWITSRTFVYQESRQMGTINDWYLVTLPDERLDYKQIGIPFVVDPIVEHLLHEEQLNCKGNLIFSGCLPHSDGEKLLFSLEQDGWLHHYLFCLATRTLTQLTQGECEDFGHAGDKPAWSPNGQCFAYASNLGDLVRRNIWVYDINSRKASRLVSHGYTNVQPKWSPDGTRIAYVHSDYHKNVDIWVDNADSSGESLQLTFSMPAGLEEKLLEPQHVTYKGALGWDIDAFLMKPANFDPNKEYPAIVWVHGGPMRQLRGSWHPMRSYALFYAYNHYLTSRGYIVLEVNYRGGIGYGTKFRFGLHHKMGVDDVVDVVNAGRYLKSLPFVKADAVAVYGLSYGGYMTLHSLTQYPEEFAMGVNIAGIWDEAQWSRWIEKNSGRRHNLFSINLGGAPDESPELYAQASPVTFKAALNKPLISFHGTKDANVDFEQMDRIVADCVEMGKTYEAYYYPGEVHTFAYKHTWLDAFTKMEREFDKYLK